MCCGKGRAAAASAPPASLHAAPAPFPQPPAAAREPALAAPATVRVRYTQGTSVRVRGPASGRVYEFPVASPVQSVEVRDAEVLVGSGFFRRVR